MEKNYEYRFELAPGKHVFLPTKDCVRQGHRAVASLLKRWTPEDYFYHFHKRGGHVAALRPHVHSAVKASTDLTNFFPSISRTKVHRALKSVGYTNRHALDLATEACVEFAGNKFLPYGFVQSMALATLVVEKSLLGQKIKEIRKLGGRVTMYVDDILISGDEYDQVASHFGEITDAARESGFQISEAKSSPPRESLRAFNCVLSNGEIHIVDDRMQKFIEDGLASGNPTKEAILRYVGVLNDEQRSFLEREFY